MAIYPLEFYRRAEEKWRRRSESLRDAVTGSPSKKEGDDTLVRWPWLLAIGQGLQSEYAVSARLSPWLKSIIRRISSPRAFRTATMVAKSSAGFSRPRRSFSPEQL